MPAKAASNKPVIRSSKYGKGRTKLTATITVAYGGTAQSFADHIEDSLGDYYNGHGEYRIEVKKVSDADFEKALA